MIPGLGSKLVKSLGSGAGIGGVLGGLGSIGDGEDDTFEDVGVGAAFGLGGAGGILGGMKLGGKKGFMLGAGSGALGAGGAIGRARNFDYSTQGASPDAPGSILSGLGGTIGALGSLIANGGPQKHPWDIGNLPDWMQNQSSFYGGAGMPDMTPRSLAEWQADPGLNNVANSQVIAANAATMREIESIKKRRDIELDQNSELSKEYQAHANRIQADDVDATKAIMDHSAALQESTSDEARQMVDDTEAALAGNNHTRDELAASAALQEDRLAQARMSDQKLLERLGIGSQTILQDMAAAEGLQSKNNAVQIRTSSADAITEKNRETADRWKFDKPNILNSLVDGAMQNETQQRQFGLNMYQAKMQNAAAMRDAQSRYFMGQQEMAAQQAQAQGGIGGAQLYGDSGFTFKNQDDDSTQNIPEYALMPLPQAMANGVTPDQWEAWQPAVDALRAGMQGE